MMEILRTAFEGFRGVPEATASVKNVAVAVLAALAFAGCVSSGGRDSTLKSSMTADETAGQANKQLGTVYLRQGNLPLAKEKLERAEKYTPRDPEVHMALAVLYERLDIPKEVDSHYRTAVRLAPKDPAVLNNYAGYLCRTGRLKEGVDRFLEAARNPLYRTPEMAFTNAGVCLRKAKRFDEAANSFQRALTIRANNAEATFQAADLAFDQGDPVKARGLVDKYLGTYDATPDLLLLAVRIARSQGDRVAEDKFTRRLRVEFPNSQQFRSLSSDSAATTNRTPG
jgi:type IV pilus assembly protein PilF